jgi:hypothetical protein
MLIFASKDLDCFMSFGSRRGFPYTTDGGIEYALSLDESNVEMFNTGANALSPTAGTPRLPPEIQRRFVVAKAADGTVKKVPILTRTLYDALILGSARSAPAVGEESTAGTSFVIVQKSPERILRPVVSLDTGKIDGDQP